MATQTARAAAWRERREKEGKAQTIVWLDLDLRAALDEKIKAGEFRNRSEAMVAAISGMIKGDTSCNP